MRRRTFALSMVVAWVALLAASFVGAAQATSRVERRCADPRPCSPAWSSTLLVYVMDSEGAAIPDARIAINPPVFSGPPNKHLESVQTNWHGMAAISLEANVDYRLKVSSPGFRVLDMSPLRIGDGRIEALRIRLVVDPSQLQ